MCFGEQGASALAVGRGDQQGGSGDLNSKLRQGLERKPPVGSSASPTGFAMDDGRSFWMCPVLDFFSFLLGRLVLESLMEFTGTLALFDAFFLEQQEARRH
ncbi:hypothetical protein BRADI_3g28055v3 [Brachypodium distachyon]|uniref:Uncharacterized protein n=1 Tax=Brachypodium distachyon TaxID=15368 RepID=A0A2K2CZN8_BRADI|nr:hypothetical protein BRADI_3g28055v3 [Brachypodium distachyon]